MSVRTDKEKIINEIMHLRTIVNEVKTADRKSADKILDVQRKINCIHDMIFNI